MQNQNAENGNIKDSKRDIESSIERYERRRRRCHNALPVIHLIKVHSMKSVDYWMLNIADDSFHYDSEVDKSFKRFPNLLRIR